MYELILRIFVRGRDEKSIPREKYGSFAGTVGLLCNIFLFAMKIAVGLLSASLSVVADAFNNLSDAGASVVTLLGFKLSQKPADEEHPFGHARVEYMSGAVIAVVIILLAAELFKGSVKKIINPVAVEYSAATFVVLVVAVLVKLWMRYIYLSFARRIDSATLYAASDDSRNDVFTTLVVLAGAGVQHIFRVNIDGWLGAAVAVFILLSGIGILKDTLSPLLGEGPSGKLVSDICGMILGYEGVLGTHDLVVHSYGPAKRFATAHVEMSARDDPMHSHGVIDNIERDVESRLGVKLVIHLDPVESDNEEVAEVFRELSAAVSGIDSAISIHDLRIVRTHDHTKLIFDVGVPSRYTGSDEDLKSYITAGVAAMPGEYYPVFEIDRNYNAPVKADAVGDSDVPGARHVDEDERETR